MARINNNITTTTTWAFISNNKCKDSIVSVSDVDFNNVQKQYLGDMEV